MKLSILVLYVFLISSPLIIAQDLHFSQIYFNPTVINPAYTGFYTGDYAIHSLYRNQWRIVPVAYSTISGSYDTKIIRRQKFCLSIGLNIQHDVVGDATLRTLQGEVKAALSYRLTKRHSLSVGVASGGAQKSFSIAGLTFNNQWSGDVYDPSLSSKEQFGTNTGFVSLMSTGLGWKWQHNRKRNSISGGVSFQHLNKPILSFEKNPVAKWPLRSNLHLKSRIELGDWTDLLFFGGGSIQGQNKNLITGVGLHYLLEIGENYETAIVFATATRWNDAIIPMLMFEYKGWSAGLSYDINISPYKVATNYKGGIEIALSYTSLPVPPPKIFKPCPIF